ncbi:type VII secretion protein EccE [Allokutzneria sp. A3M-2-11 16]|uniref:type VII secretion protein EccE n=1 Tax=Allokutzneria sp. A3M-2-11 16 TaxID=2962043 RepID=UPI0020B825F9|nr:type VII secretion protein EccE [Allokutzneria sp. A3M-2-11 16]MCP3802586.1 type VII secretion protein EccE [Allokutzneria sp. A3M-2-11 16]
MTSQSPPSDPRAKGTAPRRRGRAGAWFRPRRQPGRLGGFGLVRLIALQVVLLGLAYGVFQGMWALIASCVLGLLALALIFGRSHGRWWTESLALWLRFRRRRGAPAEVREDPRLAALSELAPTLVVDDVDGPNDRKLGLGSDGAGWFTVIEVAPADGSTPTPPVPLAALVKIAAEAEQAGVVTQVVAHNGPIVGPGRREHTTWVAVRLDAHAAAESMIDNEDGRVDVPAVLSEITRRVERVLQRRGHGARILTAEEVTEALARACDLARPGGPERIREEWDAWYSPWLAHTCFWVRSWPDPVRGVELLAALAELPAPMISVALLLDPTLAGADLRCLIRVAAPPDRIGQACASVLEVAARSGARLTQLDGQHAPAVYASAPSGGGAR